MDKELARRILNLLDSPEHVETLRQFAEQEISRRYSNLEGCNDLISMAREQGAITALKQLKKLRDTAVQFVENQNGKTSNPASGTR